MFRKWGQAHSDQIKNSFKDYHDFIKANANLGDLEISSITLNNVIEIDIGETSVPIKINNISGVGKLIIFNGTFNKTCDLYSLDNLKNSSLVFKDCTFNQTLKFIKVTNPNLSIVFENSTPQKLKLALDRSNIKRVLIENTIIDEFEILGENYCKSIRISHSTSNCELIRKLVQFKNSKRIVLYDINLKTETAFNDAPTPIVPAIYFNKIIFHTNFHRTSAQLDFTNRVRLLQISFQNNATLKLTSVVFRKKTVLHIIYANQLEFNNINILGDSVIEIKNVDRLIVTGSHFKKIKFSIDQCVTSYVSNTQFYNEAIFSGSTFRNATFQKNTFQDYVAFKKCIFDLAPDFTGSSFTNHTSFHGTEFKDVATKESEGRYRLLKSLMRSINNDSDEILFSSYELQSRQKDLWPSDKTEYFFSVIYKIINQYGRSIIQPFFCMIGVWLIFAACFTFTESFYIETGIKNENSVKIYGPQLTTPLDQMTLLAFSDHQAP